MSDGAPSSRHWRSSIDGDGICWLTLDKAGSGANTLSAEVVAELGRELDALRATLLTRLQRPEEATLVTAHTA